MSRAGAVGMRCGSPIMGSSFARWIVTANVIAFLNDEARRREVAIDASVVDLESGDPELGIERFDLIVAVNYLHRPLFPFLLTALRSRRGARLRDIHARAGASGKAHQPGLPSRTRRAPTPRRALSILAEREGEDRGQFTASIVARKD